MLTDKDIEKVSDVVAKRMEIVTQRYLEMVAKSVKKIGSLSATDAHRIKHMASLGADLKQIKAYLGKELGMDEKAVESLFATFAKDAYDAQAVYYNATGTFQKTFAENKELQDILKAQYRNTQGDFKNIANSTGVALHDRDGKVVYKSLDEAYNDTIDEAITAVTSGVSDFNSEMRRSLTDLANSGVRTIDYASGYSRSIESAVRANIFEGIQRCMQETREQAGREFGANGVEISVHMKCAPDHLPYQGKQYSDEKFKYLQGTLTRPIGHLNCRHHIFPIVMGVSNPAYSPAQLRQIQQENTAKSVTIDGKQYTPYEATQIQRKLENSIRKQKDVYNTLLEAGDKEGANGAKNRLRQLFNKYTDVSNQAGLKKQSFRTFMPTKKDVNNTVDKVKEVASKPAKIAKPVGQPQVKKVTNKQEAFASLQETFTDVNKGVLKLDEDLFVENVNRFNELNDRFGAVSANNGSLFDVSSKTKYIAYVQDAYYNPKEKVTLCLSNKFYKNIDILQDSYKRGQETFFKMPSSDNFKNTYTITHEYGHIVEAQVTSRRLRQQYTEMGFNYDTDSVEILKDFSGFKRSYKRHESDIRNEILDIAKNNNPNFDLKKNLSEYGYTNSAEFFAEVFANSQCGQPNELGKAMELWLTKEGY